MAHVSVMKKEVIANLNLKLGGIFVDCTINGGGHSSDCADIIEKSGTLVGIDADPEAINRARRNLSSKKCKKVFLLGNYRQGLKDARKKGIKKVSGVLFDLGLSSDQLENSGRGFTFQKNEPLTMTFGVVTPYTVTAQDVVNRWSEESLSDIIFGYGGERYARRIAREIVGERKESPLETTFDLVRAIRRAVPYEYLTQRIHPATRTFQAIRIAVNDELGSLREALPIALEMLDKKGRLVVISFHSLEDRIVKDFMRGAKRDGLVRLITKKPLEASDEETALNVRARSAKLRCCEKI